MTAIATCIRKPRRRSTASLDQSAPQGEMSLPEKNILCTIVRESDELPYPLRPLEMASGPAEQVYDIPEEARAEVLQNVWPFMACPGMDDEQFDLHESKYFRFREAQVIRYKDRNLMVSPYYAHSGGMVIDFLTREAIEDTDNPCVMTTRE